MPEKISEAPVRERADESAGEPGLLELPGQQAESRPESSTEQSPSTDEPGREQAPAGTPERNTEATPIPAAQPGPSAAPVRESSFPLPTPVLPSRPQVRPPLPIVPLPGEKGKKKKNKDKKKNKHGHDGYAIEAVPFEGEEAEQAGKWLRKKFYEKELRRLQYELVKMQYWVRAKGLRVVLIFEGRDAAGKGGVTSRILQPLNPRGVRLVALPKPSDVERTQWYFQRYVAHLPSAGEIVIFDRSWYNRSVVERVMGFCTDEEYWEFLSSCPEFEKMLVRSGIILLKYWLSVSDAEQERRFQDRAADPTRRWKLSPIDIAARDRWVQFSKAKDIMLEHTDTPMARWYQIEADDKRRARLNCIRHILGMVPYSDATPEPIVLPPRPPADEHYMRPPRDRHIIVPDYYPDHG